MRLTIRSMGGPRWMLYHRPHGGLHVPAGGDHEQHRPGGSSSSLTPAQPRRAAAHAKLRNRPGGGTARATLTVPKSGGSTRGDYPSAFLRWHVYDNAINTYVKSITR